MRQTIGVEHINRHEAAVGGVAVMLGGAWRARDLELVDVGSTIRVHHGRHGLGAGGVVVVRRIGSIARDHLSKVERSIRMRAGDADNLAGRIEMLVLGRVGLAGDVVGPIVLGMIGVDNIGRRLHPGGVDRRGIVAVRLLHDLTGEVARGVVEVGGLGAVAGLDQMEGGRAVAMALQLRGQEPCRIVGVMFARVRLTLDVQKGDVFATIGMENGRHRLGAGGVV